MNRERGVSSLALVLLLLVLGSLLLQGLNQQQTHFSRRVALESQALQRQALVQSAIEWAECSIGAQALKNSVGIMRRKGFPSACVRSMENARCLLQAGRGHHYGDRRNSAKKASCFLRLAGAIFARCGRLRYASFPEPPAWF